MKAKQAIRILEIQKNKLSSEKMLYDQPWFVQTRSYFKKFFGEDSPEYKYIDYFKPNPYNTDEDDPNILKSFLDTSIESLKNKGVHKPPALNFLHTIPNEWVIGAFSLIVTATGFVGYTIGKTEASVTQIKQDMRIKELEDSLRIRPALNIPKQETTDGAKKNK